jgi:predicted HTH transcriptional regulator
VAAEAIVNAVAHRDYTSNGSVQVMLFADRLEVWNPVGLPPSMTLVKLRAAHGSVPANPLVAEPMYLAGYIERPGTGTRDMIRRCVEAGLPEPEFAVADGFQIVTRRSLAATPAEAESRPESLEVRVLSLLEHGPRSKSQLSSGLGQQGIAGQLNKVVRLLLDDQTIEYTVPGKPQSRLQKYRLTERGRATLAALKSRGHTP